MKQLELMDANARFGVSLKGHCGFREPGDVLAHFDHLSIGRGLVFNVEGRESSCPYVNRKTLEKIHNIPGGAKRLIPAFSISPVMMYGKGAMEELEQMVNDNSPLLHFTRGLSNYYIEQCEPIFDMLKDQKPIVLMHSGECEREDLLKTAENNPEITFILTENMWPRMNHVLDYMERCSNICADSSVLHTWNDIEILCERFGPERVVFGAGEKANYGGAITALVHADISEEAKEYIAHGNIQRMLKLKPDSKSAAGQSNLDHNSLWQDIVGGKPLGLPVIDAHVHLGASGGYVILHDNLDSQIEPALQTADRVGVDTMLVSSLNAIIGDPISGNKELEDTLTPYGGRFKGYVGFNPNFEDGLTELLDEYFSREFYVGFKTLCSYWNIPITDKRFNSMFGYADEHCLPILNHTWNGDTCSPGQFTDIVKEYPNAQFILGHSGGGNSGRLEAEKLASENDNVWLEWCGTFCSTISWEESFTRVDPSKMIYGSDAFVHNLRWELGRLLSIDLSEDVIAPMLGKTMQSILDMRK